MKSVPEAIEEVIEPVESRNVGLSNFSSSTPKAIKEQKKPQLNINTSTYSAPVLPTDEVDDIQSVLNDEERDEPENQEAIFRNLTSQALPNSVLKRRSAAYSISNPQTPTTPTFQGSFNRLKQFNPRYRDSMGGVQPQSLDQATFSNTNENSAGKRYTYSDRKRSSFVNNFHEIGSAFRMISRNRNSDNFSNSERRTGIPTYAPDDQELRTKQLASDLIASLLAGGPASLFAGTNFLRDAHGHRRAPILLAMLDVKITRLNDNSQPYSGDRENTNENHIDPTLQRRQSTTASILSGRFLKSSKPGLKDINNYGKRTLFEINLEYGIDDYRAKWKVIKTYGSMIDLHNKLKTLILQYTVQDILNAERKTKLLLPRFPRKNKRFKEGGNTKEKYWDNDRSHRDSLISSASSMSSTSLNSHLIFNVENVHLKHLEDLINEQDDYNQPIHKRLERYFRLLNLALCLRPDANLLIQYYEFSTIGNLLSYEAGYKGKEGLLINGTTASGQGWKVPYFTGSVVKEVVQRHTTKWCLIRDSYIMYVSDIFSTTPLEVFLVDSDFNVNFSGEDTFYSKSKQGVDLDITGDDIEWDLEDSKKISTNLSFTLTNGERKLKFLCRTEYSMRLWVLSIKEMVKNSVWAGQKRFGSFAPVRKNVFAKFLVDGRDYFWSLSSALMKAEDVIYIHDWWLSPELYLRRPMSGNQEYRIDRILKKKAEEGVKIFIIVYRNVGKTVMTDSLWTKHSFLLLHKNIHLIRSPNQWKQNILFWAHHEKFTVIDNTIAFMGGIDLCYGRYDTPEHSLRDDDPDIIKQTFPGKDYSNARISDFVSLEKPFESAYDRNIISRMPWHDVHTMIIGEPARDMARHFVQRWNYAIRRKRPSRPTPLLLPPIDFSTEELNNSPLFSSLKSKSTCEIQVLRSAGSWSLGLKEKEQSIQNAYIKLIEQSQHYIYIENQFFVTSSSWDGVVIENRIGNAIVDRVVRAHIEGKPWKAFIVIPLMPGFDSPIEDSKAYSLRVIIQCQYKSISRGPTSIFGKLQKLGINPHKYIQFFSLRKWSTMGPDNLLRTEQLYVHAKLLIVDDRSCIIGSANINERSQLGDRDSEVAAIIRDTATVKSRMNNEPYIAGKFPLELRQKLMREHLGCDVDLVEIVERKFNRLESLATLNYKTLNTLNENETSKKELRGSALLELAYREVFGCDYSPYWKAKYDKGDSDDTDSFGITKKLDLAKENELYTSVFNEEAAGNISALPSINRYKKKIHSFNYRAGTDNIGLKSDKEVSKDVRLVNNHEHENDVLGKGVDGWENVTKDFKDNVTKQLQQWANDLMSFKESPLSKEETGELSNMFLPFKENIKAYIEDESITNTNKWDMLKRIHYLQYLNYKETHKLNEEFISQQNSNHETSNNSQLPTDMSQEDDDGSDQRLQSLLKKELPPEIYYNDLQNSNSFLNLDFVDPYSLDDPICPEFFEDIWFCTAVKNTTIFRMVFHCQPDNTVNTWRTYKDFGKMYDAFERKQTEDKNNTTNKLSIKKVSSKKSTLNGSKELQNRNSDADTEISREIDTNSNSLILEERRNYPSHHLNSSISGLSDPILNKRDAMKLLKQVKGHLVLFATEWLSEEIDSNNWFFSSDRLPPIEVFD